VKFSSRGDPRDRPPGEFDLIRRFASQLRLPKNVLIGPGDDCAVVRVGSRKLLLTTDLLIENIHFRRDWMSPEEIGFKAMRVNLSDIAAMGGEPRFALVSLGLPVDARGRYAEKLFRGLRRAAEESGAVVVGGDTNAAAKLIVNVVVMGETGGKVLLRRGAQVGDDLYVTGSLGGSALGLEALKRGRCKGSEAFIARHKKPPLRVTIGRQLALRPGLTAMMDLSDGLAGDLPHLLKASGVGACLDASQIPFPKLFQGVAGRMGLNATALAIAGGEDYELLFTASPRVKIPNKIGGVPITKIGKITSHAGRIEESGGVFDFDRHRGFRHF